MFVGCDVADTEKHAPAVKPAYQRFIPIHREPQNVTGVPWSGAFALDSKTGQLCETYHLNNETWAEIPLCLDLYKKYPD